MITNQDKRLAQLHRYGMLRSIVGVSALTALATLTACGGGGGGSTTVTPPAATTISGVVATGAAVAGASVTVKDADAATADVTGTANAKGEYTLDVSALKQPLVVIASGTQNGDPVTIYAVVPTLTASASNTANVTSLTNAIAALIAPGGDLNSLSTPATLTTAGSAAKVSDASKLVVNTLKTDANFSALLGSNFDPLTTTFAADGTGIDSVLDKVQVSAGTTGVVIANLAAPVSDSGIAATVTLTAAQTATPTTVPTLPPSVAASNLPSSAEMTAIAKKFEACFALPLAQRVTLDSNNDVTAVSSTCSFAPASWKSDGANWVNRVGQNILRFTFVNGAKAGAPTIASVWPAANNSGTTFQHPNCNTATCVVMNIPYVSASGKPFQQTWLMAKVGSSWDLVGDQIPYSMGVEMRLNRKVAVNTALATANPTNTNIQDHFESQIRLNFNARNTSNTSNIRAVRWTGPGLPAAGVVTHRSQACATADRFPITNQEGVLTVNNSASIQFWNGGGGNDFNIDFAKLDGTTLAMPTPSSNWTTTASPANQNFRSASYTAVIPAYTVYTAEIFYFSNTGTTPDEIIKVRNNTPSEPASAGVNKNWPTLAGSFVDNYLKNTGSSAGSITSLSNTISWTNPVNDYVSFAYLFGQNRVTLTNAENETAGYLKRGNILFRPTSFGDSSTTGYEFTDPRSGTELSSSTSSSGSNPNPRCTTPEIAANDSSAYREAGLQFRGADRKLYQSIYFWNN